MKKWIWAAFAGAVAGAIAWFWDATMLAGVAAVAAVMAFVIGLSWWAEKE